MFHGLSARQQLQVAMELQNVLEELETSTLRKAG